MRLKKGKVPSEDDVDIKQVKEVDVEMKNYKPKL